MERLEKQLRAPDEPDRIDDPSPPFRSYALERSDDPRFHIRLVERTQRFYPAHKHDYFQIIYFMTEAPTARIGLTSRKPKAGSIYFIGPMVPHQIRFDDMTRCVVLYFDLDFLRPGITRTYPIGEIIRMAPELTPFAWQGHVDFKLDETIRPRIENAFRSMIAQRDGAAPFSREVIHAELSLVLASFCQHHASQLDSVLAHLPAMGRDGGHMRRIAEFVAENYLRAPSLEEAAVAVRLSRSRLCALVREHAGTSFNALIREMRIDDARERLLLTDEPISRIAYSVGYNDEKYFLRAFRRSTGMTPTAYRQKQARAGHGTTRSQGTSRRRPDEAFYLGDGSLS